MGEDHKVVVNSLNLITQRRNQIVHQSDYPSYNLERESINIHQSTWVMDFIDNLVHVIHNELEAYILTQEEILQI